jgi:hypothetical protein
MKSISSNSPKKKKFYEKWWFWVIIVIVGLGILSEIGSLMTPEREPYDNEQIDVNGLVIKEACEKVRAKGWLVSSVEGKNDGHIVETSDCSNDTNKVSGFEYHTNKALYESPSVTLEFSSDKTSETNNDSESDSSKTDSPSDTNNDSSSNNPTTPPPSTPVQPTTPTIPSKSTIVDYCVQTGNGLRELGYSDAQIRAECEDEYNFMTDQEKINYKEMYSF